MASRKRAAVGSTSKGTANKSKSSKKPATSSPTPMPLKTEGKAEDAPKVDAALAAAGTDLATSAPKSTSAPEGASAASSPTAASLQGIVRVVNELSATYTSELQSKMSRLDDLIGNRHWVSVGNYKEALIREQIADKIPRRYEVSTGFILAISGSTRLLSNQLDIIIWDSEQHAPIFRDREFVIVPPEACRVVIEVKANLTTGELKDALKALESLMQFIPFLGHQRPLYKAIFAFEKDDKAKFPDSLLNGLFSYYSGVKNPNLQERLLPMRNRSLPWRLSWVNAIVILGEGVISLRDWDVNDEPYLCYAAFKTKEGDVDDTYGYLERDILVDLLAGHNRSSMGLIYPAMTDFLFCKAPEFIDGKSCLLFPQIDADKIKKIGRCTEQQLAETIDRLYTPRKPQEKKTDPSKTTPRKKRTKAAKGT